MVKIPSFRTLYIVEGLFLLVNRLKLLLPSYHYKKGIKNILKMIYKVNFFAFSKNIYFTKNDSTSLFYLNIIITAIRIPYQYSISIRAVCFDFSQVTDDCLVEHKQQYWIWWSLGHIQKLDILWANMLHKNGRNIVNS